MLVHDRATPLARRRTPEGFLEMRARIGRAGMQDDRARCATTSHLVAELRAEIKARDDEIRVLRAQVVADAAYDVPSDQPFGATNGMTTFTTTPSKSNIDGLRRSAIAAALGPETVGSYNKSCMSAVLDTLAAMNFARCFDPRLSIIALQARNEAISNAWKPEVSKVSLAATRVAIPWLDAKAASCLTEPRDGDGRWTATGSSKTSPDADYFSSVSGSSIGGYNLNTGMLASGQSGNLKQAEAEQRTAAISVPSSGTSFAEKLQIAYPDGWRACHEKCLQETEHIRAPDRVLVYRRCVRECLGPDADY